MAWSNPTTYSTGAVLSAATMNTFERDNTNLTLPALSTTAGQMFYASAANTPTVLAPSTVNNAVLRYNTTGGVPEWSGNAANLAVQVGQSLSTSGAAISTSTYTTYSQSTFVMPAGWQTAKVLAWGSVSVGATGAGGDTNAVLRGRVRIDGSASTWRPSNALTTSENDAQANVTFSTTVAASTAVTWRAATTDNRVTGGASINMPVSTAARVGDLAWLSLYNADGINPAGFSGDVSKFTQWNTLLYEGPTPDFRGSVWYKTVQSSDIGSTFTFTASGGVLDGLLTYQAAAGSVTTGIDSVATINITPDVTFAGNVVVPTAGMGVVFARNQDGNNALFGPATDVTTLFSSGGHGAFYTTSSGALSMTITTQNWDGYGAAAAVTLGAGAKIIDIQGTIVTSTINVASFKGSDINWVAVRKT